MKGPRGEAVTVKNAKYAMQMFIRRLIALCGTLPDLPQRRYLNMHLFYTDKCDPEYEPPGFNKSNDNKVTFPETEEWKKATSNCGGMDAGFHTVSLKVSHLHLTTQGEAINEDEEGNLQIPNYLTYAAPGSREDDIDIHMVDVSRPLSQEKASEFDIRKQADHSRRMDSISNALRSVRTSSHKLTEKLGQQSERAINREGGFEAARPPPGNVDHSMRVEYASSPAVQIIDISTPLAEDSESQPLIQLPEDLHIKKQLQHMVCSFSLLYPKPMSSTNSRI